MDGPWSTIIFPSAFQLPVDLSMRLRENGATKHVGAGDHENFSFFAKDDGKDDLRELHFSEIPGIRKVEELVVA